MKRTKILIIALFLLLSSVFVNSDACCANRNQPANIFCIAPYSGTEAECCPATGYTTVGPLDQQQCQSSYYSSSQSCFAYPPCKQGCCCLPRKNFAREAECAAGQFYENLDAAACDAQCGSTTPPGGTPGGGTTGGGGTPGGGTPATCTDADGDGFGTAAGCTKSGIDCNDNDKDINPDGTDVCGNTIDEDCSGKDAECPPGCTPSCPPVTGQECKGEPFSITRAKSDCDSITGCFYDKSATTVNDCYRCDPAMACYDYKSANACSSDACSIGNCEWRSTYAEGGYGVCVSTVNNLCAWCPKKGTEAPPNNFNGFVVETYEAHNDVYDACTDSRKAAMSTPLFDCGGQASTQSCVDADGDTYGQACAAGPDCDDSNKDIHPFEPEICGNNIDEDCSAGDLQCPSVCTDNDKDTYGSGSGCTGNDCNDNNGAIHPGAQEICGNTIDEDCSAGDLSCPASCTDNDKDTYGSGTGCSGTDCNDNNINVHPGAADNCGDGIDEDCSGSDSVCANLCAAISVKPPSSPVAGASGAFEGTSAYNYGTPALALGTGGQVSSGPAAFSPSSGYGWRWQATVTTNPGSYTATVTGTKDGQQCTGSSGYNVAAAPGSCSSSNCNACTSQLSCPSGCNWCSGNICQSQACGTPPGTSPCTDVDKDDYGTTGSTGCAQQGVDCNDNNPLIKPMATEAICDGLDNNCNGQIDDVANGCPMAITLTRPANGATNITPFDVEINTDRNAACKHRPVNSGYASMFSFPQENNRTFVQPAYELQGTQDFYVRCRNSENGNEDLAKFELIYDTTRPVILEASASPGVVADYPLLARLLVRTDDKTFCRYGTGKEYDRLQFRFSRFSETNSSEYFTVSSKDIAELVDNTRYYYNISCKNLVGLASSMAQVTFLVNTSAPAELEIISPADGMKTKNAEITINARTNKKAICHYGNSSEPSASSGSFGTETTTHESSPIEYSEGSHRIYVKCGFATMQGLSYKSASAAFTIDLSPPSEPSIDDSSGYADPQKTQRKDMLSARFRSGDPESGIAFYNYTIFFTEGISDILILNWTKTTEERVNARNLNLSEGTTYYFRAKAINSVGLESGENESDGIKVDSQASPQTCANNRTDIGETGRDCGGLCGGCPAGESCNSTIDCFGNLYCNSSKKCAFPECDDGFKNQDESDIDCGGDACIPCIENSKCIEDRDCISEECGLNGKCTSAGTCSNGRKDDDESDIDCGLKCADTYNKKCDGSKKCKSNLDCKSGKCNSGMCGKTGDMDNDNISDSSDNCPESYNPKQEDLDKDKKGDACDNDKDGDGMLDECEKIYFGSTECSEEKCKPESDPDEDGLKNREECTSVPFTNPLEKDTDGDGYSDGEELEKGTDPNDPESHPGGFSFFKLLLWMLAIILLMAAGIYGYGYYRKRKGQGKETQAFAPPTLTRPKPIGPADARKPIPQLSQKQQLMLKKKRDEEEKKEREKLFEAFDVKESGEKKEELQKPEHPDMPVIKPVEEPPLYPERTDVYKKIAEITRQKPEKPFKELKGKKK